MATPRENLKKFLQENIDFEDYDNKENTIQHVFDQCMEEYGHEFRRLGKSSSIVSEWLRGLPNCVSLPFYTHEITDLIYALGYEPNGRDAHEMDRIYWAELGIIICEESQVKA